MPCKHWCLSTASRHVFGQSTMASIIAVRLAVQHGMRVLIVHNDELNSGSEQLLCSSKLHSRHMIASTERYGDVPDGWTAVQRYLRSHQLNSELLVSCTTPVIPKLDIIRVTGLVQPRKEDSNETNELMPSCIQWMTIAYDIIIWDLNVRDILISSVTKKEEDESSILNQCNLFNWFTEETYGLIQIMSQVRTDKDKAAHVLRLDPDPLERVSPMKYRLGLINMYDPELLINLTHIRRKYKSQPVFAVPYDSALRNSSAGGTLLPYLMRLSYRMGQGEQVPLLRGIDKVVEHIILCSNTVGRQSWDGARQWG
ncbi:hypothetical protein [Paenibacillus sp. ACRRX]|uniref:hypothetical protein n=1 Tax=Paenibacillus sp. ACRRX TaxID=2918206 RepID=UPI001EF521FA|nr:hypothetical protein [Paenibacillus sp. ACRRX]